MYGFGDFCRKICSKYWQMQKDMNKMHIKKEVKEMRGVKN
jgi:hypothetical protein